MARYRANVTFGPWHVGDIFESEDPFHTECVESGLLTRLGASIFDDEPVATEDEVESVGTPPPENLEVLITDESP